MWKNLRAGECRFVAETTSISARMSTHIRSPTSASNLSHLAPDPGRLTLRPPGLGGPTPNSRDGSDDTIEDDEHCPHPESWSQGMIVSVRTENWRRHAPHFQKRRWVGLPVRLARLLRFAGFKK
jgi:hypothetical protein